MAPKTAKPETTKPETKDGKGGFSIRYVLTVLLLVMIVVAFVFFPTVGKMDGTGGQDLVMGSFAGKPIAFQSGNYFARQVETIDNYYQSQGYSSQDNPLYILQVWQQAFNQTAIHLGVLDDARRAGLSVSEKHVDETVLNDPEFMEDGVPSLTLIRKASPARVAEKRVAAREDYLKTTYVTDLIVYRPSERERSLVSQAMKRERSFDYVSFPFSEYPKTEMAAFGAANPEHFARLTVSRLTVDKDKAEAEQIRQKVVSNAMAFVDAAKNYSKDSYKDIGGAMGQKRLYEVATDLANRDDAKALASLKKGEVSAVFETSSGGWSFYKADEDPVAPDFADDTTLKHVGIYLSGWERGKLEDYCKAKAADFIKVAAVDYAKAVKDFGRETKSAGPFPLNYGNAFEDPQRPLFKSVRIDGDAALSNVAEDEAFFRQLWKTAPGAVSEPLVAKESVIVLRVKEESSAGDEGLLAMEYYYPTICVQSFENAYYERLLKSPRLKDNFQEVAAKLIKPNTAK